MLIICPSCATSYDVRPDILGSSGRSVRCVRCEKVWHADLPRAQKLLNAAAAIGAPVSQAPSDPPGVADWADRPSEPQWTHAGAAERPFDHDQIGGAAQEWPFPDTPVEPAPEADEAATGDLPGVAAGEAPPIAPVDLDESRPMGIDVADEPRDIEPTDVETFAARRARRLAEHRRLRWPLSYLQTAILALIVVDSVLIGWRSDVVRVLPQTASFYTLIGLPVNLRGLAFDRIDIVKEQHEGVPVLVVEGNIVNGARRTVEVPRLKLAVRNAAGQEIYSWTAMPPRTVLPAGETVAFRSRLASPPPEGREVLVRFLNRRDLVAGVR